MVVIPVPKYYSCLYRNWYKIYTVYFLVFYMLKLLGKSNSSNNPALNNLVIWLFIFCSIKIVHQQGFLKIYWFCRSLLCALVLHRICVLQIPIYFYLIFWSFVFVYQGLPDVVICLNTQSCTLQINLIKRYF